jgi:hypothetical protein
LIQSVANDDDHTISHPKPKRSKQKSFAVIDHSIDLNDPKNDDLTNAIVNVILPLKSGRTDDSKIGTDTIKATATTDIDDFSGVRLVQSDYVEDEDKFEANSLKKASLHVQSNDSYSPIARNNSSLVNGTRTLNSTTSDMNIKLVTEVPMTVEEEEEEKEFLLEMELITCISIA